MSNLTSNYVPSSKILSNYARVLINFALNSGKGVKSGEVVYLVTQQPGIPLAKEMYSAILSAGAHPMLQIIDDDFKLLQFKESTDEQLSFFPQKYYRGLADSIDHWVRILADKDPHFFESCDPAKLLLSQRSAKPFREWLDKKEDKGRFTWTLCLYGTAGLAAEAGISLKDYWKQIETACFLNTPDPIARWQSVFKQTQNIISRLNRLPIDKIHVESKGTDLWLTLGENRRWLGGSGRNIPSFEIFTSPDWRGTEGTISFDLPLYRYGSIIKDIRLEFKKGKVVKASAAKNQKLLLELIKQKNADKVGEFSLTDCRFSRITSFMADTLYDENFGGKYGNTHIALGKSYHDTYSGNISRTSASVFKKLGFNESPEHTDIIDSKDRRVTALMRDGSLRVIYQFGSFNL